MKRPLILLAAVCLLLPAGSALAEKGKRFGIEGEIVGYDASRQVLEVRVTETNVQGRSLSGNTVGGRAPNDIKRAKNYEFAVEPTGSVLRRTVIKAQTGGGLDTTGTPEGFEKALAQVPDDRPLVMSLESNKDAKDGAPKYKILMIQIQYTMDELRERFDRISEEVE